MLTVEVIVVYSLTEYRKKEVNFLAYLTDIQYREDLLAWMRRKTLRMGLVYRVHFYFELKKGRFSYQASPFTL